MAKRMKKGRPTYGGVDPGKDGFLVLYDGERIVDSARIPYLASEIDVVRLLRILRAWKIERNCVLANVEYQQPYPGQGGRSNFTIGEGYGTLRTAFAASGIPIERPKPAAWKRGIGIPIPKRSALPRLPKKPAGAKRGSRQIKRWKVEYDSITKKRRAISAAAKARRKDLACQRAIDLQPNYDFRVSVRPDAKPHNGKCEAFLLAVLAHRTHTPGRPR